MASDNLQIPLATESQDEKLTTINDGVQRLENALTDNLIQAYSSDANITLSAANSAQKCERGFRRSPSSVARIRRILWKA